MRWLLSLVLAVSCQAQATLTARSWLITDADLHVQAGQNYHELRSIASLTKLLTVMVAIDDGTAQPDLVNLAMVNSNNHAKVCVTLRLRRSRPDADRGAKWPTSAPPRGG